MSSTNSETNSQIAVFYEPRLPFWQAGLFLCSKCCQFLKLPCFPIFFACFLLDLGRYPRQARVGLRRARLAARCFAPGASRPPSASLAQARPAAAQTTWPVTRFQLENQCFMFGFFKKNDKNKKEELHYDPLNIVVTDLRRGWLFDFEGQTWDVVEEYEYDWGEDFFTYAYLIQSESGQQFMLDIDEDEGLQCWIYERIPFRDLPNAAALADSMVDEQRPPRELQFRGQRYFRDSEAGGFFRNIEQTEFREFIFWHYSDDSGDWNLRLEQWGEDDFKAALGRWVAEGEFSNFLPVNKSK